MKDAFRFSCNVLAAMLAAVVLGPAVAVKLAVEEFVLLPWSLKFVAAAYVAAFIV